MILTAIGNDSDVKPEEICIETACANKVYLLYLSFWKLAKLLRILAILHP